MSPSRFEDQVVVVTGAANGIGECVARRFAGEGARLVLVDRAAEVEDLASELAAGADRASPMIGDVADEAFVGSVASQAVGRYGGVDVLVCAAGVLQEPATLTELSLDEWERVMAVNVRGTFLLCRQIVPTMMNRGRGAIVNFASVAARSGQAGLAAYSASKAAVVGLSESLAAEVAARGVRVNVVAPGYVDTAMTGEAMRALSAAESRPEGSVRRRHAGKVPIGRFAEAAEIADTVVFLASAESRYVTGACLDVNGGLLLGY